MNNYKKMVAITAASLAAVIAIYYLTNESDIDLVAESVSATDETSPNGKEGSEAPSITHLISEGSGAPASSARNIMSEFEATVSAEDAMAVIDQAYDMGESTLAQQLEVELHNRCERVDTDFEPPFAESKWAYDDIIKYCSTYRPLMSFESLEKRSAGILGSKMGRASNLFQEYLKTDHAEVESDFIDRMANASSALDFQIGSDVLQLMYNSGIPLSMGQDVNQYSPANQTLRTKFVALKLYSCYRLGGCDSNSHQVRQMCVFLPQCERDWTLVDVYVNTLSPIDFDTVTDIFMYLYNHQRGG